MRLVFSPFLLLLCLGGASTRAKRLHHGNRSTLSVDQSQKLQQDATNPKHKALLAHTTTTESRSTRNNRDAYNPLRMYLRCMGIVLVWISSGTLFYAFCNDWPLPQSFFYAVDAGMSIGFCTQVYEKKLVSKAFTILYILLGASVVGGALALFIGDAVEGLSTPSVQEYHVLLEKQVFDQADVSRTGVLSKEEFEALMRESTSSQDFSKEDVERLWSVFDKLKDGVIHLKEFVGTYRGIDHLVQSLKEQQKHSFWIGRVAQKIRFFARKAWHLEHRIYTVFVLWVSMGIGWGIKQQRWDPITATHFAISALATGGLTAPDVDPRTGILDPEPAIFCGIFCLLGIPLFALTLGHFARVLVSDHWKKLEASALTRSLTKHEYELACHLTTDDSVVHFSDFVVLQLLRQGKLTVEMLKVLKQNFDSLDTNGSGSLTLEQATNPIETSPNP